MALWNALRQSRSTGISARSRRPPGAGTGALGGGDEGGIWVALWKGGAIYRYAPDASLVASVQLARGRSASCAFGGPRGDTLLVTTARTDLGDDALARQPDAGKVLA